MFVQGTSPGLGEVWLHYKDKDLTEGMFIPQRIIGVQYPFH